MKIWLINQYNMPPEYGHLNRHFNFGKYLKRMGHEPTVFVGSFLHNTKTQMLEDYSIIRKYENADYPYYFIKTCDYSSSKLKRIYAMYEFYKNLLKAIKSFDKPDAILGSSAHPLAAIAAIKLGKKYGCQSIVEVRDLWPESFVAYGILSKKNPVLQLLYAGEKWIYKNADKLVFTMEGGRDYIIEQGWSSEQGGPIDINKVHHLNNGVDLEVFNKNKEHYQLHDEDLDDSSTFKVVYAGSIRLVNKVEMLVDVAKMLEGENVKFLVWGNGDQFKHIEQRIKNENINNIVLKGRVDKKYIPYITSKADLNIISGTSNPLYKYGASLNKMFDYFASGRPILSTKTYGYSLIKHYGAGTELENSSVGSITKAILNYKSLSKQEYEEQCTNARKAANDYSFENLSKGLIKIMKE